MAGGRVHQYANSVGQVSYYDTATGETTMALPAGFEMDQRTPGVALHQSLGLNVLIDPNPPPPQTYLDVRNVRVGLDLLLRVPESREALYRKPMGLILRFLFPESAGYDVTQELESENSRPDFSTFKISQRPGGTMYQYEFMLVESKKQGRAWGATEDQLLDHLSGNRNDSKNCYGMVRVGLEVQFYRYERHEFSKLGGRMNIVNNVNEITRWAQWLMAHPMSFV